MVGFWCCMTLPLVLTLSALKCLYPPLLLTYQSLATAAQNGPVVVYSLHCHGAFGNSGTLISLLQKAHLEGKSIILERILTRIENPK